MNTLKVKIIAFFLSTAILIFTSLAIVILKLERQERIDDLVSILSHLSSEIITDHLQDPSPGCDLGYLVTLDHTQTLVRDKAIGTPAFKITASLPKELTDPARIYVVTRMESGAYFVASSDTRSVDRSLHRLALKLIATFIIALALLTALFYLVLKRLLRPIESLSQACATFDLTAGRGEFPSLFGASVEIAQLGDAMETLMGKIAVLRAKEHQTFKEAAHQLKTPLAILKARVDHYSLDVQADKTEFLSRINADIAKIIRLLKELLIVEQSRSGQDESAEAVDLGTLIADAASYISPLLNRKHQTFKREGNETFTVQTPRRALTKLVLTILENCVNHAPENAVITVTVSSRDRSVRFGNPVAADATPALFNSDLGLRIIRELSASLGTHVTVSTQDDAFLLDLGWPPS